MPAGRPAANGRRSRFRRFPAAKPTTIYLVDKPGSAQSTFAIGLPGPPRTTPDYYALQVMNTILGGMFQARLNANIREEKGYSYGVGSGFGFGKGPNPFRTGGDIVGDKTDAALIEFMKELRGILGARPVTEEELRTAKESLVQRLPATFASVSAINGAITGLWLQSLPDNYYQQYAKSVMAITQTTSCASRRNISISIISRSSSSAIRRRLRSRCERRRSRRSRTWTSRAIRSRLVHSPWSWVVGWTMACHRRRTTASQSSSGLSGGMPRAALAPPLTVGTLPFFNVAAIARIEPVHRKLAGRLRQIEVVVPAGRQIHQIHVVRLCEAVPAVVVLLVAHKAVGVRHLPERNLLGVEEVDRDAAVVPALVAAAEILGHEIVVRKPVAEVVLDARAARHQIAPQRVLANVMERVADVDGPCASFPAKPEYPGSGGTPRPAGPCSSFATTHGFFACDEASTHLNVRSCTAFHAICSDAPVNGERLPSRAG